MNDEILAVIDVDSEDASVSTESIQNWLSAQEAFHRSRLKNKPAFQRAMKDLTVLHHFPAEFISRGKARNTEYSNLAVRAISLLREGRIAEVEGLKQEVAVRSTSIIRIDRHNQIARSASSRAAENLTAIATETGNLLSKFELWGEALGEEAASQIEASFTKKIAERLQRLTNS